MKSLIALLLLLSCLLLGTNSFSQEIPEAKDGMIGVDLPDAIAMALKNYEKMKISESEVEITQGQEWQSLAYVLPSLSGSYQYSRALKKPAIFFETGKVEIGFDNVQQWNLNISQPLTRFGGLIQGVKAGKRAYEASQWANIQTQADVVFEVKQSYYTAMLRRAQKRVAEVSLEAAEEIQKREEVRYRNGEIPEFDYNRAALEAENKRSFLYETQGNYENSLKTLRRLMGLPPDQLITLTAQWEKYAQPFQEKDWVALFESTNPTLKSWQKTAESKEASRKVAQSNLLPYFNFFTSYQAVGQSSVHFFPSTNEYFNALSVGLNVEIPIFDGMLSWGQYKSAEAGAAKAQWQKQGIAKDLRLELDRAIVEARINWDKQKVLSKSVQLAETLFRQAGLRFKSGLLSYIDLKDVENQLEQTRLRYIQSIYEYALSQARIEQLIGSPWTGKDSIN